jgi:hypothetical protein
LVFNLILGKTKIPEKMRKFANGHLIEYLPVKLLILCLTSQITLSGQYDTAGINDRNPGAAERTIPLFDSDDILNVTLYLDLASFSKKPSKTDTYEADMAIHFNETDSLNRKLIIKYRGISRYDLCNFPPMQLNFKKPVYCDSAKIRKLKLVTHCRPGTLSDEYVLREYLVYKLYNALTDTSFRVRLLRISYVDTKRNKKTITKYGFFIEPIELVSKRTNSTVVKVKTVDQRHIIPGLMDRVSIFNYMISNWDWSVPGQHNVAVIKPMNSDSQLGIAIPYDFDLTGIVNADYAIPPPEIGIKNVRERKFSGVCRTREVFTEDLRNFSGSRDNLYSVVNTFPHLNQRSKKDIINFLDEFFDQIEKQNNLDNLVTVLLRSCKK